MLDGHWLDAGEHIRCTACDEVAYYGDDDARDCKHCGAGLDFEIEGNPHAVACIKPRSES